MPSDTTPLYNLTQTSVCKISKVILKLECREVFLNAKNVCSRNSGKLGDSLMSYLKYENMYVNWDRKNMEAVVQLK